MYNQIIKFFIFVILKRLHKSKTRKFVKNNTFSYLHTITAYSQGSTKLLRKYAFTLKNDMCNNHLFLTV